MILFLKWNFGGKQAAWRQLKTLHTEEGAVSFCANLMKVYDRKLHPAFKKLTKKRIKQIREAKLTADELITAYVATAAQLGKSDR